MRYTIEWVIEGRTEIEADSTAEARRKFQQIPSYVLADDEAVQENQIIPDDDARGMMHAEWREAVIKYASRLVEDLTGKPIYAGTKEGAA